MLVIIFRFLALDAKLYACLDNIIALPALAKTKRRCGVQTCLCKGKGDGEEKGKEQREVGVAKNFASTHKLG